MVTITEMPQPKSVGAGTSSTRPKSDHADFGQPPPGFQSAGAYDAAINQRAP